MRLEARAGIEPAHKGFADLSLTTWVPRLDVELLCLPYRLLGPKSSPRKATWSAMYNPLGFDYPVDEKF